MIPGETIWEWIKESRELARRKLSKKLKDKQQKQDYGTDRSNKGKA